MKTYSVAFIFVTALAVLWGCSANRVAVCTAPEDNQQLHYVAGMELVEKGDLQGGRQRLERAIYCDAGFSSAYDGLAIVEARIAAGTTDLTAKATEERLVEANLKKAYQGAKSSEARFTHTIAVIRSQTALGGKDFIETANAAYRQAEGMKIKGTSLLYYESREAIDYYMGMACRKAQEFTEAKGRFEAVLKATKDGKWVGKADRAWKETDRTVRAMAGLTVSDLGRKIAVERVVTRSELTALLIREIDLGALPPGKAGNAGRLSPVPTDVASSPIRDDILAVLRRNLRGLEPSYDAASGAYLFNPAGFVKRGEMALLLEDVVIRMSGDEKIASAYLGHEKSPFVDIAPTSRFYNAVMNATTRGLMEGETAGVFRVEDPVSGADAVLALRALREKMKGH